MNGPDATTSNGSAPTGVHVVAGPQAATGPVLDQTLARAAATAIRFDLDDPADHSRLIAEIPAVSLFGGARVLVAHGTDVSDLVRDALTHLPVADLAVLVLPKAPKPALTGPGGSLATVVTVDAEKVRDADVARWLATHTHQLSAAAVRNLRTLGDPADCVGLLRTLTVLSHARPVTDNDLAELAGHLTQTSNAGPWRVWDLLWDDRLDEALVAAQDQAPLAAWSYISQTLGRALLLVDHQAAPAPSSRGAQDRQLVGDTQVLGCTPNQAAAARRVADRVAESSWARLMRLCVDVDTRLKVDPDPAAQLAAALTALHTCIHPRTAPTVQPSDARPL